MQDDSRTAVPSMCIYNSSGAAVWISRICCSLLNTHLLDAGQNASLSKCDRVSGLLLLSNSQNSIFQERKPKYTLHHLVRERRAMLAAMADEEPPRLVSGKGGQALDVLAHSRQTTRRASRTNHGYTHVYVYIYILYCICIYIYV